MSPKARLRVVVADDEPAVSAALAQLISDEPSFELVGVAADAATAISLAAAEQPDVVLLDVRMPGGGVAAVRGISRRSPATKVIALSGQGDRATVLQMLEAGVVGYLLKGGSIDEIVEAIKRAPEGQGSLSIELTGEIIEELTEQLSVNTKARKKQETVKRRIRRAIESVDALAIVFQPIVGLRDRSIVGAEALARFAGPPRRAPNLWFDEAATVGLRQALELVAADRAIEALPQLPPQVYLTINASPRTLTSAGFLKLVSHADGSRLVAEITEHAPIHDYARLGGALTKLRALGMRLAIDDAGAGYSSLRHILELQPDLIKLDMSLIRGIHRDRSKQALAAGLISFASKAGSSIIAEGIERAREVETLVELGVSHGQGFFLGKPAPLPLGQTHQRQPQPRRPRRP
jgi:EAL domain-containing protein (putative c-di-GMP-specific phosphodiesterase class I)/DNA-binding NarL/FixJ family response regulator